MPEETHCAAVGMAVEESGGGGGLMVCRRVPPWCQPLAARGVDCAAGCAGFMFFASFISCQAQRGRKAHSTTVIKALV